MPITRGDDIESINKIFNIIKQTAIGNIDFYICASRPNIKLIDEIVQKTNVPKKQTLYLYKCTDNFYLKGSDERYFTKNFSESIFDVLKMKLF